MQVPVFYVRGIRCSIHPDDASAIAAWTAPRDPALAARIMHALKAGSSTRVDLEIGEDEIVHAAVQALRPWRSPRQTARLERELAAFISATI